MRILRGDLWRRPEFMRVWTAQAISELGARFARDGLPLTAVLVLRANPGQVGLLSALATAPRVLVGLLAGGLIDRSRRRPVMIGADLVRAVLLATIPLAAVLHWLSLPQLYLVAFLVGAGSVVFDIANQAYVPDLVDPEHLVEGNTKLSVTASLANVGGPAITGLLIQLLTAPITIGVTCISYLASAAFLSRVHDHEEPPPKARDIWLADFRQGLGAVLKDPLMRPVCLMDTSANVFVAMFAALYPFIALRELHLTPAMFGVTFAAGGLGALVGAAVRPWLVKRLGFGATALTAATLAGVVSFAIPLTHLPPIPAMVVLSLAQFAGDGFSTVSGIIINTVRQTRYDTTDLGRVGAVFQVTDGAAAMFGALLGGLLGQLAGAREGMLVASAGLTLSIGWSVFSPLRKLSGPPSKQGGPDAGC